MFSICTSKTEIINKHIYFIFDYVEAEYCLYCFVTPQGHINYIETLHRGASLYRAWEMVLEIRVVHARIFVCAHQSSRGYFGTFKTPNNSKSVAACYS